MAEKCLKYNGLSEETQLDRGQRQPKKPLRDASDVNATSWTLFNALKTTSLLIVFASGGGVKCSRQRLSIPKIHALDVVCVGAFGTLTDWWVPTLTIKATGRDSCKHALTPGFVGWLCVDLTLCSTMVTTK